MINQSDAGDTVWVAAGTYKPKYRADNMSNADPNDRDNAFVLKEGVKVYGSFAGTESLLAQRDTTVIANNPSILSGDIGALNDITDNAFHVVVSVGCSNATVLDGFIVEKGNANNSTNAYITVDGEDLFQNRGGGIINHHSSPVLSHISIRNNNAYSAGGGIYNETSSPVLTYATILNNNANVAGMGGGMHNYLASSPVLTYVAIQGNYANYNGGGIYNDNYMTSSYPVLTNVIITDNSSSYSGGGICNGNNVHDVLTNVTIGGNTASEGGGIYVSSLTSILQIRNSIIYSNTSGISGAGNPAAVITYSLVQQRGSTSNGNMDGYVTDPLFMDPGNGDFRLQPASPVINQGNSAYYSADSTPDLSAIAADLDGNIRIAESAVDMGAYEANSTPLPLTFINFTAIAEKQRAKLNWTTTEETNNKEFIISRSADGKNFREISRTAGAANTSGINNYVFYDEHPVAGNNFYRLQQQDIDGRITDAGIRMLQFFSRDKGVYLFPNPVKSNLEIHFSAGVFQSLELYDLNGKMLQSLKISSGDQEKSLNTGNLAAGIYFVRLTGNGITEIQKVVKK